MLVIFVLTVLVLSATAQNNQLLVQLTGYDSSTYQSKIHIQNTAGFELNELDFYINNIKTGRVADRLADGKAVLYFQTVTPGTYDITIKTKEGIEYTKEIKFGEVIPIVESEAQETKLKTASKLVQDLKYQELLRERAIEQEIKEQRQQANLDQQKQEIVGVEPIEEKGEPEKAAEEPMYFPIVIIIILFFIFALIYIFKKKRK